MSDLPLYPGMGEPAPAPTTPTLDQILGAPPKPPTLDEILAKRPSVGNSWIAPPFADQIGEALVHTLPSALAKGWGAADLAPETVQTLKDAGIFNDYEKGQNSIVRHFNEWLFSTGNSILNRLPAAVHEAAIESPALGPLAAAMEAFPAGHLTGFPAPVAAPPPNVVSRALGIAPKEAAGFSAENAAAAARARTELPPSGVESPTERVVTPTSPDWTGTAEPAAEGDAEIAANAARARGAISYETAEPAAPDIHAVARGIAPDTLAEYDALTGRRDTFRRWLDELSDSRANSEQAQALQGRIDDILGKLNGVEDRLTKAAAARLEAARTELDGFLRTDTPDMTRVRQELKKTDYARRDLLPARREAYRQAAEQMPKAEEPAVAEPAAPQPDAEAVQASEAAPAPEIAPKPEPAAPAAAEPATAAPALPSIAEAPKTPAAPLEGGIAGDVARQLIAAGRPAEEAQAAGALLKAHYETWADQFPALGSAEDIYRSEAPNVRAGRGVRALELAQNGELGQTRRGKIRLATDDAKATVTLFKDADASTFIHETGHAWLEELTKFAARDDAPPQLRQDAATMRQWLGVEEGTEIPTRAHEKAARGFERYLMEGLAPSAKLAGVFAKFRDWLTRIYETVAGLRSPINDDIRGVFDRMLASKNEGEAIIAPERAEPTTAPTAPGRELGPTAAPKSRTNVYETVPKEPRRLVDFLRREGGLRDDGGDIGHIIGGKNQRPGLINGKGKSLDDAALRAWEEGYFPEHGANRPTINDLLDAIREDVSGNPQYSHKDRAMVEAYRGAMARNAEIDRLGEAMGVNPRDYTREQFFDMAAEHMSREEQAREIGSQEAEFERAFAEAEAREKQAIEDRGDAWEPEAVYGTNEPRTPEDMENAYKSEAEALGGPGESPGSAVEPGRVAGGAEPLQEGAGSRGSGAGPSGRTGASAGEASAGPDAGSAGSGAARVEVDRTAWIDRLNTTKDAKNIILEMSARTQDFRDARFGQAAYQLYHDARAARQLVESVSQATVEAGKKWADSGSEADAVAYARTSQQLLMAAELYNEIKAGWGRAGHAFQRIDRIAAGQTIGDYVKRITGRSLDQLIQERDLSQALPDADARAAFLGETRQTTWQKIRAGYLSYFINNLISGPITHGAYAVGNTSLAIFKGAVDTSWAAAIDSAREMIAGKPLPERVEWAEVPAQLYGAMRGWRDGLGAAGEALRTGVPYMKGADLITKASEGAEFPSIQQAISRPQAIPGKIGYVLETPSRAVTAIHTLFYSMNYEQEIARLAVRSAMTNGLEGEAYNAHVAEFTQNPPLEAIEHAHDEALAMVLMKRPAFGSAMSNIQRAVNQNVVAKTIMPFMQIGSNILDQAFVQHTPVAFASQAARDNLFGRNGEVARSLQYGKIASGVMLSGIVVGLAAEELMTGGGPSDPHERMRKELTGWKPYSIRIGDHYYPYRKFLGPIGALIGGVANMYEVGHTAGTDGFAAAASAAIFGFSEVVADETWLRGLSDFINAARNWDKDGGRYLRNLGSDFVPFAIGMGQMGQLIDPYQREVHSFTDAVKNKIPVLRQTLEPRNDFYGEPIAQHTMIGPSQAVNDPVTNALIRLDIPIAAITRKIDGVGLDDRQYAELTQTAGRLVKMRLDSIVGDANFENLPEASQRDMITKTIDAARKQARALISAQDEDIGAAARAAKEAYREGASHKQKLEMLKAR